MFRAQLSELAWVVWDDVVPVLERLVVEKDDELSGQVLPGDWHQWPGNVEVGEVDSAVRVEIGCA